MDFKLYEYRQQIMDRMDKYHVITDPKQYHWMTKLYEKLIDEESKELNEAKRLSYLPHIIKETIDLYWVMVWYAYRCVLYTGDQNHPAVLRIQNLENEYIWQLSDKSLLYKCLEAVIVSNNTKQVPDIESEGYAPTNKIPKWPSYVAPDLELLIKKHVIFEELTP